MPTPFERKNIPGSRENKLILLDLKIIFFSTRIKDQRAVIIYSRIKREFSFRTSAIPEKYDGFSFLIYAQFFHANDSRAT